MNGGPQLRLVTVDEYPQSDAGVGPVPEGDSFVGDLHVHINAYLRARAGSAAPLTVRSEAHILRQWAIHMGGWNLHQIGAKHLDGWLEDIAGLAASTRRNRLMVVRAFFRWAVARDLVRRNPTDHVSAPKVGRSRHRALTPDQAAAALDACEDSRDRLLIILGLQLGLRRAEIAGLTLEDIDRTVGHMRVTGKGGHQRDLTIPAELDEAIEAYLADAGHLHGPLIRYDWNPVGPVPPVWVGRRVSAILYRAGVKRKAWDGVSTHALRHTAATDVARATKGNVVAVRDLLGHASLTPTHRYIAGDPESLRGAIEGRRYGRKAS